MAEIAHLFISPDHNFFGHHDRTPGAHPLLECDTVECVAQRGLRGDRFFDDAENYKGQVTFFSHENYEAMGSALGVAHRSPAVFRRNIITRGLDLNELIGRQFLLDGIHFEGTEECRPCAWMDEAFGPGAENWLRGRGGLRARILSDGRLRCGPDVAREVLDAAAV